MHQILSLFVVKINKLIGHKSYRYFHETISLKLKARFQPNKYLLNRNVPPIEVLNNLTDEDAERLADIKNEYNIFLANGQLVPKILEDIDLLELLCLSYYQRIKFLRYLAKNEFSRENHRSKVMQNAAKMMQIATEDRYSVDLNNTFLGKYYNKKVTDLFTQRSFEAIILKSQELVFDFSFENDMSRREVKESAKQFQDCFALNRRLLEPFQLTALNIEPESITSYDVRRFFVGEKGNKYKKLTDFPINFRLNSLPNLFPEKNIVYLSPNSTKTFEEGEYDHDGIYVIGAIVDKGAQIPLTLAKARKEGLKHRSLPLDRHINWKTGNKNLPLNQVFSIMAIARETNGDWGTAIRKSLPPRIATPY